MVSPPKKLLIAGGGYADIPLIRAAKKLGFYVITSGNRPDELGHTVSDEYCACDFSDPQAMLQLAKKLEINALCACANDFSATSCAYVAEQLGLPGHDVYAISKRLHSKDTFRDFCQKNNLFNLKARCFNTLESALSGMLAFTPPFMVKPVDLTGGKGVEKIDDFVQAKSALEKAFLLSRAHRVIVEDFITGSNHGLSTFLRKGKVVFSFCDNEHYYLNRFMVSAASTPSRVPRQVISILKDQIEKIALLLELKDGIFHVQFILHNNEPILIEACRRAPGDLYVTLVEHATGVDYASWIVKASVGLDCSALSQQEIRGFFTRHCIMGDRSGVLEDVCIDPSVIENIIDQVTWWKPGDRIENYLSYKCGITFLKFSTMDEMLIKTEEMPRFIVAKIV